jgi:uncharacterized protein (UPF0335 family)
MKTETQMYEEYIASQKARLEALEKEKAMIEKDIDNVTKLMVSCPYESSK